MDPDANLREQRELVAEAQKIRDECPYPGEFTPYQQDRLIEIAIRMGELVEALDGWITNGGYYPKRWRNK